MLENSDKDSKSIADAIAQGEPKEKIPPPIHVVPGPNRILRTPDVIEGIAHMHNQSLFYFDVSTWAVLATMRHPDKVPKKFKPMDWIESSS